MKLHFEPIDLGRFALCQQFRSETQLASFGTPSGFHDQDGGTAYRAFLTERLAWNADACVHAWLGAMLVGQVEMGLDRENDDGGYVNLFYLVPELRGSGLADELVEYALRFFGKLGCVRAGLSVSEKNLRAIRFYERHGFVDVGARPDIPQLRAMELTLTPRARSPRAPGVSSRRGSTGGSSSSPQP